MSALAAASQVVALVLMPAVFLAAALPTNVQGFGVTQAATVIAFAPYGPPGHREAAVLAYSLAVTSLSLILQVVLGLLFLPAARKLDLGATRPAVAP